MEKRYKKDETIGNRIHQYRKQKGMTAEELGIQVKASRQLVDKWEHDLRDPMPYIDELCKVFNVERNKLLYGIESDNIPVFADLGLSDCAIEELRRLNRFPKGKHTANIRFSESDSGSLEHMGYSPEENLHMINYLLSSISGMKLLSLLYRYCFADFENAYLHQDDTDTDIVVDSLVFMNRSTPTGKTVVHTELMRYAIMKGIENVIDEMASNVKGDV